jgi:hypothetical protein
MNTSDPPQLLTALSGKPMQSPSLLNCDFVQNALEKRLGKVKQGDSLINLTINASQTVSTSGLSLGSSTTRIAQKFTAGASATISAVAINVAAGSAITATAYLYSDSAGTPNASLGIIGVNSLPVNSFPFPPPVVFTGSGTVNVTIGTVYWIVLVYASGTQILASYNNPTASGRLKYFNLANVWATTAFGDDTVFYVYSGAVGAIQGIYDYRYGNATITQAIMGTINGGLYYKSGSSWTSIKSGLGSGQNVLFDFATAQNRLFSTDYGNNLPQVWDGSSTGTMAGGYRLSPRYVASGTPRAATISSTSGSILTMAASQPASGLYRGKQITLTGGTTTYPETGIVKSFVTTGLQGAANYYVTSITLEDTPLAADRTAAKWNGVTTAFSGSGSITTLTTLTCIKIIGVTQLKSGGFRCTDEISIDIAIAAGSQKIDLSNIAMNSSADGTQFAFDIGTSATTWFATPAFDPQLVPTDANSGPSQIYYRIPDEKGGATVWTSTGFNPMPNSTTSFSIKTLPTSAQDTLEVTYRFPQAYFTGQVDMPRFKFLKAWQGFLCGMGDPENPSRLWISAQNSPQVWGTAGGVNGAFLPIPIGNDGQIGTGLYVWRSDLYVFKNNSVYRTQYTGNLGLSPFRVDPVQGEIGALSHWAIKESDFGIIFLSVKGVAVCLGTSVQILPESDNLTNLFLLSDPGRFNTASMQYSTALLYSSKSQIWFGVSSTSATTRDLVLVYDYDKRTFWLDDGISANYFANVGDTNGFPQPYSGDYSAQIFLHDSGTNDNGSPINWNYSTPHIMFRDITGWKRGVWLWISGFVQSSGTLYVDEYCDFSATVTTTYEFNMADANFRMGLQERLSNRSKYSRFVLRNSELNVPVKIESLQIDYEDDGQQQ